MKKFKQLKLLSLALTAAACSVSATDFTAPLEFQTLPEVTVSEIRAISFGQVLALSQASVCTMDADGGTEVLSGVQLGRATSGAGSITYTGSGALSGTCTGNGTVGIYEVSSFGGAPVKVDVVTSTDSSDIQFAPIGAVINHDDDGNGTFDDPAFEAVDSSTSANAFATNVLSTESQVGKNRILMGGTITNLQALTAETEYTATFQINVTYQ